MYHDKSKTQRQNDTTRYCSFTICINTQYGTDHYKDVNKDS